MLLAILLTKEFYSEGDMKKFLRILEGLGINIGFILFGYFLLKLFYFILGSPKIIFYYL